MRTAAHASAAVTERFQSRNALLEQAIVNPGLHINPRDCIAALPGLPPSDFESEMIRELIARVAQLERPGAELPQLDPNTTAIRHHVRQYTAQIALAIGRVRKLEQELSAEQGRSRLHNQRVGKSQAAILHWQRIAAGGPNAAREQQTLLQNINGQANEVIESLNLQIDNAERKPESRDRRIARRDRNIEHLCGPDCTIARRECRFESRK